MRDTERKTKVGETTRGGALSLSLALAFALSVVVKT